MSKKSCKHVNLQRAYVQTHVYSYLYEYKPMYIQLREDLKANGLKKNKVIRIGFVEDITTQHN
jgi:hypothetical protein